MANWLHQLQSLLGQQGASPSGESSKGSGLLPGAIGGLAGLLVASKSLALIHIVRCRRSTRSRSRRSPDH